MKDSSADGISQIQVFDRKAVRRHRDRAAPRFGEYRALFDAVAARLAERIDDVTRDFPAILDLGAHDGGLAQRLAAGHGDGFIVAADLSEKLIRRYNGIAVVADEEWLPFAANSFDLVVSNLSLHWVNDLPGALWQIKRILRPGGLFLAAVLGGETLRELRASLVEAELALKGGISPRLSPTLSLLAASGLMQRAGFALPVVDHEVMTLVYKDMRDLAIDLRGMGETNSHNQRLKMFSSSNLFAMSAGFYQNHYGDDQGIRATFDVIFLHGWKT